MTRVALLALIAGCGFRITPGATADSGTTDAEIVDGDLPGDGAVDAMPVDGPFQSTCLLAWLNHTITFQPPSELTQLNTTSYDRDPFVSADELTLWYSSGNAASLGGGDVFASTRLTRAQPFGLPVRDADFSTASALESKMSVTDNRLYAVVGSNLAGGAGATDIWETSRANASAAWGMLSRAHTLNLATAASELDPFVTPDGLRIYYAPNTPAPQRIVVAARADVNDSFSLPVEVANINTSSGEADPMVFASERVIVFASDRAAQNGSGNIWYATRNNATDTFGTPVELPGVNTGSDEADPHVSADGCRIYFARNVGGGLDWQLFTASGQ